MIIGGKYVTKLSDAVKSVSNALKSNSSSSSKSSSSSSSSKSSSSSSSSSSGPKTTTTSSGVVVTVNPDGTTRKYTAADHSTEHVNTSTGTDIDKKVLDAAIKNGTAYKNTITGINTYDNSKVTYEGYVLNGVTYTKDGQRIVQGGNANQSGLIPGKDDIERNVKTNTTTVWYYQAPPKQPDPPRDDDDDDDYYVPEPEPYIPPEPDYDPMPTPPSYSPAPSPPVYEVFNTPQPTFSADLQRAQRFIYFLGLDKLEVKSVVQEKNCIRILKEVDVTSAEWIELEVEDYIPDKASIEYYIIDGENEVAILPNNRKEMKNEKIFPNINTLFEIKDENYTIRKDGEVISSKFEEIRNNRDAVYSITYKVEDKNRHTPKSDKVKVKVILRLYDDTSDAPFISDIKVKIYGGEGTLWQENI